MKTDSIIKSVLNNDALFKDIVENIIEESFTRIIVNVDGNRIIVDIDTDNIKPELDDETNLSNIKIIIGRETPDIGVDYITHYTLVQLITEPQKEQLLRAIRQVRIRKFEHMFVDAAMTAKKLITWIRKVRRKTKVPKIAPYQFMSLQHYKRYILLRHFVKRHRESIRYYFSQSYHVYAVARPRAPAFFVIGVDDSGKYFCDYITDSQFSAYEFVERHPQFFVDDKVVKWEIFGYTNELVGNILTVNPGGYRVQGDLKVSVTNAGFVTLLRRNDVAEYLVKEMAKRHPDVKKRIDTEMLYNIDRDIFTNHNRLRFIPDVLTYIESKYRFEALQLLNRKVKFVMGKRYGNKHVIIIEKGVPIRGPDENNPAVLILTQTTVTIKHKEHGVKKLIAPANVILQFYI